MKEKVTHCFIHDRFYKHKKWKNIVIKPSYIKPSEEYAIIKGYIYDIKKYKENGNKPINTGTITEITILEQELDNWLEVIL